MAPPRWFYPAGCHGPLLSRRRLLAGGAAAALSLAAPGRAAGSADGGATVRRWATLPEDPWAVCHGVRAMGQAHALKDGRRAASWLLETHLASVSANGQEVLAFPRQVEVHPNMFLKTLLEAGVPLDHAFTHGGRPRALREVAEGARVLFRPAHVVGEANMLPWSIIAFALTTSPMRPRWSNAWGEAVDLDQVVESALRLLEQGSAPLARAMREGHAMSVRAPVHAFTCGGTHMLYALLTAVGAGYAGRGRLERVRAQASLMLWRLSADAELIDRFYRERATEPGAYWYALDARLKLLGHGEECLALGVRRGVLKLNAAQERQRAAAVAALTRTIEDMEGRNVAEARDLDLELFRQLIGDTCHARHALNFA